MKRRFLGILAVIIYTALPVCMALAAESNTEEKTTKEKSEVSEKPLTQEDAKLLEEQKEKEELEKSGLTPNEKAKQDALTEKLVVLTKQLGLNELQHFMVIYANYMVLSMVKAVQSDVEKAVEGCSNNNIGIAAEMRGRFETWKAAVADPMKEAQANVNNMVLAQTYISQNEVQDLFTLVDETRAKNSSEFEKVPVTTLEACQYMKGKMDETQANMIQMLRSTLVTYPDLLQKTQE